MIDKEYVQFSKRVTKWGMALISFTMAACLSSIVFLQLPKYAVDAVAGLYTTFCAVLGMTIGAYQGNSSLEKWSKAKYGLDEDEENSDEKDDDEGENEDKEEDIAEEENEEPAG